MASTVGGRVLRWACLAFISSGGAAFADAQSPATRPADTAPASHSLEDLTNLSLEDLMNVEVTSVSKHAQKISDAPAAITVISQTDIERSGLQTIPELLRLAPGLDVARINSSQWAVSSRGFNDQFANKMLVLMDGRTVYDPLFSGVYWDMQDYVLQDLDRIEVIRGPGATMWGANAVNGVINIESKTARDTQGWLIDGLGGNEQIAGSVRYGAKLDDRTYFRVFTKYRSFEDFPLANDDEAHDGSQSLMGGLRIDHYASNRDTLTLIANGSGAREGQMLSLPTIVPPAFRTTEESSFNAYGANVLGRWTHVFSDTSDMAVQLYYDHINRKVDLNPYTVDTVDLDMHHRFALGSRQEITWGTQLRFWADHVAPSSSTVMTPARRDDSLGSAFIQDDLTVVPDRLHLIVGTKLEVNSYSGFEVQPSGKVLWTPDDRQSVWGSIARAVRTPSRWEENARINFTGVPTGTPLPGLIQSEPNISFQSEQLIAYEVGYRVAPTHRLSIDVGGFYNDYDKLEGFQVQSPIPQAGPPPYLLIPDRVVNNLYGESYGAEIAGNWKVTDAWRLAASYSWLDLQIHHSSPESGGTEQALERSSPRNQFQLHSNWDVLRNVQFNASGYYVERLGIGVPSYFRVDLGVTWRPKNGLELTAGVQNLLDNQHPEFIGTRILNVASEVPRTFYGELTWRF